MRGSRRFFRYLAFTLEIVLLWVLQSTPKLMPELFGAKPVLLLAAALSFASCCEVIPSVVLGAVCGVLCDLSSGGTVGWFSIITALLCYGISSVLGVYLNRNVLTAGVLSAGGILLALGLYFLFFRVIAGVPECGALFTGHYLPRMLYTLAAFFPLYFLNKFLAKSFAAG